MELIDIPRWPEDFLTKPYCQICLAANGANCYEKCKTRKHYFCKSCAEDYKKGERMTVELDSKQRPTPIYYWDDCPVCNYQAYCRHINYLVNRR